MNKLQFRAGLVACAAVCAISAAWTAWSVGRSARAARAAEHRLEHVRQVIAHTDASLLSAGLVPTTASSIPTRSNQAGAPSVRAHRDALLASLSDSGIAAEALQRIQPASPLGPSSGAPPSARAHEAPAELAVVLEPVPVAQLGRWLAQGAHSDESRWGWVMTRLSIRPIAQGPDAPAGLRVEADVRMLPPHASPPVHGEASDAHTIPRTEALP